MYVFIYVFIYLFIKEAVMDFLFGIAKGKHPEVSWEEIRLANEAMDRFGPYDATKAPRVDKTLSEHYLWYGYVASKNKHIKTNEKERYK